MHRALMCSKSQGRFWMAISVASAFCLVDLDRLTKRAIENAIAAATAQASASNKIVVHAKELVDWEGK